MPAGGRGWRSGGKKDGAREWRVIMLPQGGGDIREKQAGFEGVGGGMDCDRPERLLFYMW